MDNSAYVEYVNSNESKIAKHVNDCFESSKDFIRTELISAIKEYLNSIPVHYDWRPDGNPYDISGEIIKNGYVLLDQTIDSFLENEYSGNTEATCISGMGLIYNTYGDELRYVTMQIAPDIMCSTIKENIENYFDVSLSDEDFEYIEDSCRAFDPIYDECLASDFFNCESPVKNQKMSAKPYQQRGWYQAVRSLRKAVFFIYGALFLCFVDFHDFCCFRDMY